MPAVWSSTATTACWREGGERRGPLAGREHTSWGGRPSESSLLPPHRRPGPGGRDGELPGLLPGGAQHHPLRHAARGRLDAMLRHSARKTFITDEQAYRDVRASVMAG